MKLPNLPKPKSSKPGARSQVRMPHGLEDLYRDMRDRRLLLPALLLIVAIVAVPVTLKAPKEAPPEPLTYVPPEGAEQVAPAVLTEQSLGVRDYRERLDELKSKNPFAGNFSFPKDSKGGEGTVASEPIVADDGAAPAGGSGINGPGAPNNDLNTPIGPGTPPEPPADTGGGSNDGQVLILAPRIDVSAGRVGRRKDIKGVTIGDLLPDRRRAPVVMFLSASEDLKFAQFLISSDVIETEGDGHCRPTRNNCEFLRLRDGEMQSFLYEPDGRRYVLRVTDIREKVVDRRKVADK